LFHEPASETHEKKSPEKTVVAGLGVVGVLNVVPGVDVIQVQLEVVAGVDFMNSEKS
jgi:hypothetical protein